MSWEVWGDPPDPQSNPCELCEEELGSSVGCKLCDEFNRANKAELELMQLRQTLRHRFRILKTRNIYEGAKKENGVSVELLQAMSLLFGIKGVLHPHEYEPVLVAEAEKALLTFENGRHLYSDQPGCNCHYRDKPHPAIHADTCPYRIRFAAAWGMKDAPGVAPAAADQSKGGA
jgi:hypothetical protein